MMKISTVLVGICANSVMVSSISTSSHATSTISSGNIVTAVVPQVIKVAEPIALSERERDCLARNVFFEAGVEQHVGKIAVAQVTYNRMKKRVKADLCKIVYAHAQFSWTLDRKKRVMQPKGQLWEASKKAVDDFVVGKRVKGLEYSDHYHTDYIKKPKWSYGMRVAHKIGQHIFYVS